MKRKRAFRPDRTRLVERFIRRSSREKIEEKKKRSVDEEIIRIDERNVQPRKSAR